MRIVVLFISLCIVLVANGQSDKSKVIIDYKDGSVFIGHILEEDRKSIILLTTTGDSLNIVKKEIKKRVDTKDYLITSRGRFHKTNGNFFSLDLAVHPSDENPMVSFSLIYGRRLKPNMSLGIGLSNTIAAAQPYGLWLDHQFLQPFIYGKYYLNTKRFRYFADSKLGWGLPRVGNFWNEHSGGLYINPGIGVELANRKKLKWQFRLSQNLQHTTGSQRNFDGFNMPYNVDYNIFYNRTTFSIGLIF